MRVVCGRSFSSLLLLLGGCGLTLDIGPQARAAQVGAAHDAAKRDAGSIDGGVVDAGEPQLDATVALDARPGHDSGTLVGGACPPIVSDRDLGLYPFDGNLDNVAGGGLTSGRLTERDGTVSTTSDFAAFVPSSLEPACGEALHFTPATAREFTAVVVPPWDSDSYEIASVSAWFKPTPAAEIRSRGIVSRDSTGQTAAGHLTVFLDERQMRIGVRLQTNVVEVLLCSELTVSYDAWHHVAVVLGEAPALLLDGVAQRGNGSLLPAGVVEIPCQGSTRAPPVPMTGSPDPWVIGASAWFASEGSAAPLDMPWSGYLDHIRIQAR
jgi:hypothetical protein